MRSCWRSCGMYGDMLLQEIKHSTISSALSAIESERWRNQNLSSRAFSRNGGSIPKIVSDAIFKFRCGVDQITTVECTEHRASWNFHGLSENKFFSWRCHSISWGHSLWSAGSKITFRDIISSCGVRYNKLELNLIYSAKELNIKRGIPSAHQADGSISKQKHNTKSIQTTQKFIQVKTTCDLLTTSLNNHIWIN